MSRLWILTHNSSNYVESLLIILCTLENIAQYISIAITLPGGVFVWGTWRTVLANTHIIIGLQHTLNKTVHRYRIRWRSLLGNSRVLSHLSNNIRGHMTRHQCTVHRESIKHKQWPATTTRTSPITWPSNSKLITRPAYNSCPLCNVWIFRLESHGSTK